MEFFKYEHFSHRPKINPLLLTNTAHSVNIPQPVDSVSFPSTNKKGELTITNLTPDSPQIPINVRVLHRWQNGRGPVKFLFSDGTGWIDALCWPRDYMENAVKHESVLRLNHCYTVKTWRVNKIERDFREDYFPSFSGHKFIMDISQTAFSDIIPCNPALTTDFRTYMPLKLHDLRQVLSKEPEVGTCVYQFDTVGIIEEVSDERVAELTNCIFKEVSLKAEENTVTCRVYGAHTHKISKNDERKMLVLKNSKVENGRLIISEGCSFVFKISNIQDAKIFSPEQRDEYKESIEMLRPRERLSQDNEIEKRNKIQRTVMQPSDFQHYNICTIKSLTTDLAEHSMTDVYITLEYIQMTVSVYQYTGCRDCSTKVDVSKNCRKCGLPSHNGVAYFIAGNIDLYQGNDHLGNIKNCFRDLAMQINLMENAESCGFIKPGQVCKNISFIKLHGTKTKYEKNWRYEVKSIVDNLIDSQEMEDSGIASTAVSIEVKTQQFADVEPLIVDVEIQKSSVLRKYRAKSYPLNFPPKVGVLIINIQNFFFDDADYPDYDDELYREFAELDEANLKELFDQLGYYVTVKHDLLVSELDDVLQDFKNLVVSKKVDVALVFMMTHGANDHLSMVDGHVHIWRDVVYKFTNTAFPEMNGKPKAFFIQACRDFLHKSHIIKEQICFPIDEQPWDILVSFSSAPGFQSQRFRIGTIYIYKLVEILMNNSYKDDVMTLLTELKMEMSKYKEGQVTLEFNSLTKKLFLQ